MSKLLPIAVLTAGLAGGGYLQLARAQAPAAVSPQTASQAVASSRAVLDQYCVTCHSDRLKTGDLSLQTLDLSDAHGNADVLEKVVRKLRKGLMPPDGRPRPDQATMDGLATSLETALDRAAVVAPNPGPERYGRLRVRQQCGGAVDHAGADGSLHDGGHED